MKIAIFSDTFYPSVNGVASVVYQSAIGLAELGHSVCVFTVSKSSAEKLQEAALGKFQVVTLPSLSVSAIYKGERSTLPIGLALRKIRKFGPDVIHTHTPFAVGWEAVWAAKLFGIPLVGTHHTFYDHYLKHIKADFDWVKKSSWKIVASYYNRCDLVLSPTQSLADVLKLHKLKRPIEVIYNPVDANIFWPPPEKEKLKAKLRLSGEALAYMGRVSYEKSIGQVIHAFALALKKKPDLNLMIIGDGPEKDNLENLTEKLGIKSKILFTGMRKGRDLIDALQASDAFITGSISENMPISILEAMACGLPVIATKTLGIPEIVKDGKNGFLSETNKADDLAGSILKLMDSRDLLEKFSLKSREFSLLYSRDRIAKQLEECYEKLIQKKK